MMKKVFPVIALAVFSAMLGVGILTPILPIYASNLGATGLWIGVIAASYSISRALIMPLIGRWSDRRGRKIFLGIGLFSYAIVSVMYIFSGNLLSLLATRLIQGIVSGGIIPVARAWIGDISPRGQEGRWQGYFNFAFFSGSAAGPILGGILADHNINYAFAVMGVMNLISFFAVAIFLHEKVERKISARAQLSFKTIGLSPLFNGLFWQRVSLEVAMALYTVFLPLWAYGQLKMSRASIGTLMGGAMLISSLLQIVTGYLADKFDRRKLLIYGSIFNFGMVAAVPFCSSPALLITLVGLRSLGTAFSMSGSSAISISLGRRFGMGSTIGVFGLATSIGMAIGPILGGFVNDYFGGIASTFFIGAGVGLVGVIFFAWLAYRDTAEVTETVGNRAGLAAAIEPKTSIEEVEE